MAAESALSGSASTSRGKGCLFRLLALLLGLSPLLVAEGVCRVFDYGALSETNDPFVGFTAVHPLFERSGDGQRYELSPARQALFCPDSFPVVKKPDAFRVFCLGGSTVQGRPYAIETSFTTWLELGLQAAEPDRQWEVINCGGVSYASYRLVPILQEVLTYEPDLIVVYTGHNEFLEDRTYAPVKSAPRSVALAHGWSSQFRVYNLARSLWLEAKGESEWTPPTQLPADVDAVLDTYGGLAEYHRDDAWRQAVTEHFQFNLQRMMELADRDGVPLWLADPVDNLRDCPPFKSENRNDLTRDEREQFDALWQEAKELSSREGSQRIALVERALEIDDRYAAAYFLLGHELYQRHRYDEAKEAFERAKEEDVCPLRITKPLRAALTRVATQRGLPNVDVRAAFEERSPEGIPGDNLLMDHVHPTITGHQLIANLILEEMMRSGMVEGQPGWEGRRRRLVHEHLGQLDTSYYARGKERLAGLRRWTQGRARKLTTSKGE